MDRNTALGAAAGVVLAVVGAVSALFLTIDRPAEAASNDAPAVEYVDQYGNPLTATAATATPQIILVNPDGTLVDQIATEPAPTYGGAYEEHDEQEYEDDEYEDDEYEDDEYEDDDHDEHEEDEDDDHD
jgi:hypothetical protein